MWKTGRAASSPLKKPPGEGTGPTTHADSQGNIVGRVPSRGEQDVFQRAARFVFTGPVILLFLVIINVMSSPGHWWVQWAALGIGMAWVLSLLRVIRAMILLGGLAALVAFLRKR